MSNITTINCLNCNAEIDVYEILYHQLEDELKEKSFAEQKKLRDGVEAQQIKLEKQKLHVNLKKRNALLWRVGNIEVDDEI